MATNLPDPYIPQNPGDLITAENWNEMQVDIKQDIASQIKTAIAGIKSVSHADDAHTLDGKDTQALTDSILKQAEEILPQRTGYFRSFNRLKTGTEKIIKHGLKSFPLVDIYQLDYFPAVCSTGENDATPMWVNFFLYHTSERTITVKGTPTIKVPIEPSDVQPFRVLFSDMLALYKVQYTDTSTLDELETEFWKAFWATHNDEFDSDQYCHSPWFEKCCGEKRSVRQLKDQGAWDDIWFKMIPRKTINYSPGATDPSPAPTQIQVSHHDFDTVGITLLKDPVLQTGFPKTPSGFEAPENFAGELKIMVLLKV